MSTSPQAPQPSGPSPAQPSTPRRRWLGVGALGLVAGAGAFWWQQACVAPPSGAPTAAGPGPQASSPSGLGDDFWALRLPQPSGGELAFSSLKGRPLLVNFWATWCPPCVREMPLLDDFYKQNKAKGLQVLGIAIDGASPVQAFLARSPVAFTLALAGADGSALARTLGNTGGGLPYTILADAQGVIRHRQMGELQAAQLAQWAQIL